MIHVYIYTYILYIYYIYIYIYVIYLFIHGIVYLILFTYTHLRTHICRYVENVSSQMFRSGWPKFHNDKDMEISSYTQQQVPPATAWELVHVEYGN